MGKEDKDGMLLPSAEEIERLLAEAEAKGREKGFREAQLQCHGVEPYKEGEGETRTIPDWQQRLLEERKEILQRTIKLRKAIDNPYMKLNSREWEMLHHQFGSIRAYLQTLTDSCVYYGLIESGDLDLHY